MYRRGWGEMNVVCFICMYFAMSYVCKLYLMLVSKCCHLLSNSAEIESILEEEE